MYLKKNKLILCVVSSVFLLSASAYTRATSSFLSECLAPHATTTTPALQTLTATQIANALGWVETNINRCGGYYLEEPFIYPDSLLKTHPYTITSEEGLFSLHGTSVTQGKVTITQSGQQVKTNKALLYRDPSTGKISAIDLIGNVVLRDPNDLILAKKGHVDITKSTRRLEDILYRTAVYSNASDRPIFHNKELQTTRYVTQLSAWGQANAFYQNQPKIYEFEEASYSTCPPTTNEWQVKSGHIRLNKNTGRGTAWNSRLLFKGVPIFYVPYLNFPIDARRQSGFLSPTFGSSSSGAYLATPFYWNIAPNYDSTITPNYMSKRGLQMTNLFRYLEPAGTGAVKVAVLPGDKLFQSFQTAQTALHQDSTDPVTQAELHRLQHAGTTRGSLSWQDRSRFNKHWSSDVDFSYVSDDYYLQDFGGSLNTITQNQLLQQATTEYKNENWNFLGRVQSYQTLHPLEKPIFENAYARLPQLTLGADYPDNKGGFDYFINNDLTHFDIRSNPGSLMKKPIGDRVNVQPGVSLPLSWPYLFVNPRLQFEATKYQLGHVQNMQSKIPSRTLPIFDVNTNVYLDRDITLFNKPYNQTLEPQIYYTYIPYRNQNDLPLFDTTVNTLTYDQLFTYNRFSGIDRVNDANQVALGLATRFIEKASGAEKAKMAIGQIIYFQDRRVTLCDSLVCSDSPNLAINRSRHSPISTLVNYNVTDHWTITMNSIINQKSNQVDNSTVGIGYTPDARSYINLDYAFFRKGDITQPLMPDSNQNNMSQTDLAFTWPLGRDWSTLGRWTENWNRKRFQNLLYGLQYDSCCWAVRMITGRVFTGLTTNNNTTYQYNTVFFLQFALKGLGNIENADPGQVLSSKLVGYHSNFGRDF